MRKTKVETKKKDKVPVRKAIPKRLGWPDWARWYAIDENGSEYVYSSEPITAETSGQWIVSFKGEVFEARNQYVGAVPVPADLPSLRYPYWKKSLRRIIECPAQADAGEDAPDILDMTEAPGKTLVEVFARESTEEKIKRACAEVQDLLIEKNRSYGDSALHPRRIFGRGSAVEMIEARIDDKLNRIANQTGGAFGDNDVLDLLGYLILYKIAREEEHNKRRTRMPIATLRFRLPEEQEDFYNARHGDDCFMVLWDLDQYLRNRLKYEDLGYAAPAVEKAREKLHELCQDRGIKL